ncbi:MAG: YqaE/Pmp3 family membrane protein [Bacteroidetes bacterium]|nr:YqaE/Pmp3 family membrane protein [Bacteroidota bacterium]
MKTNILYSAIFALIISSVFSSCAIVQKEEFAQRKYYNFPRTNHASNPEKTDFTVSGNTKSLIAEENITTPEPVITASAGEKSIVLSTHHTELVYRKNTAAKKQNTITENSPSTDSRVFSIKKSEVLKRAINKPRNPKSSDSGEKFLIMVIAAIFLPPLGIFIKENWRKTNKWFWITLALCALSMGIWLGYSPLGAGLWLVAAVIALLNVFDML